MQDIFFQEFFAKFALRAFLVNDKLEIEIAG
jgi:hypothetical protein